MRIPTAFLLSPFFLLTTAEAQSVSAPWDIAMVSQNLAMQAARLDPLLAQLNPQAWQAKGAPAAYVTQVRSTRDEVGYLIGAANNLSRQPEKLSTAFETYFRMQSVESQVASLVEGVRRYQNPAVGDLIVIIGADRPPVGLKGDDVADPVIAPRGMDLARAEIGQELARIGHPESRSA